MSLADAPDRRQDCVLVAATVTPALVVSGTAATASLELFDSLPSYLELDPLMEPTTLFAKTSTGEDMVLTQFYDQNRAPIDYGEIPPVLDDAILSNEAPATTSTAASTSSAPPELSSTIFVAPRSRADRLSASSTSRTS